MTHIVEGVAYETPAQLRAAIEAMDRAAQGRKFNKPERERWNRLNEALEEAEADARRERVREIASRPGAGLERAFDDAPGEQPNAARGNASAHVFIPPKSRAGRRRVPIATLLRGHLIAQQLATGGRGLALRADGRPFDTAALRTQARRAWNAAELAPITLHECRHTFASLMIAAGVNAKALSTYLGHANIAVTYDRYGHLMPGNEDEAAGMLDAYLERADAVGRLANVTSTRSRRA